MQKQPKYTRFSEVVCPHCKVGVQLGAPTSGNNITFTGISLSTDIEKVDVTAAKCPLCNRIILSIQEINDYGRIRKHISDILVWPPTINREPVSIEVPKHLADDYKEAALTLPFSPKASAALSRRCLQVLLKETELSKKRDLDDQIEEAMDKLPTYIAENLDAVRNIGNFAAHQQKSKSTGEILDVEPGEAEWNLDVLDTLFDFCFVRPAIEKSKREALAKKLEEAGKPAMKQPNGGGSTTEVV